MPCSGSSQPEHADDDDDVSLRHEAPLDECDKVAMATTTSGKRLDWVLVFLCSTSKPYATFLEQKRDWLLFLNIGRSENLRNKSATLCVQYLYRVYKKASTVERRHSAAVCFVIRKHD